jgi:nitrogen regulatory protein PII
VERGEVRIGEFTISSNITFIILKERQVIVMFYAGSGDGLIAVSPVEYIIKIRTKEKIR